MIHSLRFALAMHDRFRTDEILVSEDVFHEVLHRAHRDNCQERVLLNRHYDSPRFRYIHQAEWGGVRFIHLSNVELTEHPQYAAQAVPGGAS